MEKVISLFISILLVCNVSLANCPKPVTLLDEGTPAPCTGFLFSPEQEKLVYQATEDAKYYKLLSEKLTERQALQAEQITIMDQRLQLYMNQSNELAKELNNEKNDDFWHKTLYFGLGIVVTGLAVSAAKRL